jgi:hypothetical protein
MLPGSGQLLCECPAKGLEPNGLMGISSLCNSCGYLWYSCPVLLRLPLVLLSCAGHCLAAVLVS